MGGGINNRWGSYNNYSRYSSNVRNRYEKSNCFVDPKSTRNHNNNYWSSKTIVSIFSSIVSCLFQGYAFYVCGNDYSQYKGSSRYSFYRAINTRIPLIMRIINTANIRLCGLPFIRGFYSKDIILEVMLLNNLNPITFLFIVLATGLTVGYSCRLSLCLGAITINLERIVSLNEKDYYILLGI